MADSGTYDPETITRHQKIADALLLQAAKPREIRSRLQGVGQLGEGLLAGIQSGQADKEAKDARAEALTQAIAAFGGGGQQPIAAPAAMPAPATAAPAVVADNQVPIGTTSPPDAAMPRGLRNNNPLNIEEGAFTQGQPGFAGSDGRFAKFQTPEQGIGAANALLDSYGRRGLNTPSGIVNRWAPSSDGNNTAAYAMAIAKQLGIGPNDAIPANLRPQLIAAMGQHENGRPIGDVAAALAGPQAGAGAPPQGTPPPVPQQVAGNAPAGTAGPPGGRNAAIAALLNPWTPPALASALGSQINPTYGFQTLPDGTIIRTDPKSGTVQPIYQAATKPSWGVIGEDQFGNKQYGWIDAVHQKTTAGAPVGGAASGTPSAPLTVTGPDGKPIEIPAGQDPKKFREHVTTATADARAGKLTEVQQKSDQFATRMELAEKNIAGLENLGTTLGGAAQQIAGKVPVIGAEFQNKDYQKFQQAKSQFITALLRQESGAAINKAEFDRYERELFPQPGDKPEVIAQKKESRLAAMAAMRRGAGPGSKAAAPPPDAVSSPPAAVPNDPLGIR